MQDSTAVLIDALDNLLGIFAFGLHTNRVNIITWQDSRTIKHSADNRQRSGLPNAWISDKSNRIVNGAHRTLGFEKADAALKAFPKLGHADDALRIVLVACLGINHVVLKRPPIVLDLFYLTIELLCLFSSGRLLPRCSQARAYSAPFSLLRIFEVPLVRTAAKQRIHHLELLKMLLCEAMLLSRGVDLRRSGPTSLCRRVKLRSKRL